MASRAALPTNGDCAFRREIVSLRAKSNCENASIRTEDRRIGNDRQGDGARRVPPPHQGAGLCARPACRGDSERSAQGPDRIQNHGLRHFAPAQRGRHGGRRLRCRGKRVPRRGAAAQRRDLPQDRSRCRARSGRGCGRGAPLRVGGRDGRPHEPDDLRGAGRQPQQRQDVALQCHLGRPRACGQLQWRDGGRQARFPHLPRLPLRGDRPPGNLRPDGLYARRAFRAPPHRREDPRRDHQLGGGLEPRAEPLPDDRADRHQPAHGRGAEHVRRTGAERREARLRQPRTHARRADGARRGAQQPRHRGPARYGDRRLREPRRPRAAHPHQHGHGDRGGAAPSERCAERPPRRAAEGLPAPLLCHEAP